MNKVYKVVPKYKERFDFEAKTFYKLENAEKLLIEINEMFIKLNPSYVYVNPDVAEINHVKVEDSYE